MNQKEYDQQIEYVADRCIKISPEDPGCVSRDIAEEYDWPHNVLDLTHNRQQAESDYSDLTGEEYKQSIIRWAIDYDVIEKVEELLA